jgi:AraC-like DNA-binding protein
MDRSDRFSDSSHVRREVYEAHTYIINHFLDELTWDDVAEHVGLSKNYIRTLYSEVYSYSLNQTVTGCRMKHAARLLVGTTRSVRDISIESRYQDLAYFCRRFREWSGMTPTEFRKKYTDLNYGGSTAYELVHNG